ncbi:MAG: SpoIIIAC/SpoIIIAD family protein [Gemmiger sp.]
MFVLKIAALCLVAGVLCLSLKKDQPAYAFLISTAGAVGLVIAVLNQMEPILRWIQTLSNSTMGQGVGCTLRVLGIVLVAQLAADTCRDAGMAAAASAAELCGRMLAMLEALPLLQSLLDSFSLFLQ